MVDDAEATPPTRKPATLRGLAIAPRSAFAAAAGRHAVLFLVTCFAWLLGSSAGRGSLTGAWLSGAAVLVWLVVLLRSHSRSHLPAHVQRLRSRLAWFAAEPVTCHAAAATDELEQALTADSFQILRLDGATIAGWNDLALALQQHTAALKIPNEPRARCLALLTQIHDQTKRTAVVYRNAATTLQQNPAMFCSMLTDWAGHAPHRLVRLLFFVDLAEAT